jgi:hypothetical protein
VSRYRGINSPSRRVWPRLVGLGSLGDVPPGTTLVWSGGVVYTFGAMTLSSLISEIQTILLAEGISIVSSSGPNAAASYVSVSPLPTTLVLQNSNDYSQASDIMAQVNNAIYTVTGNMPDSPTISATLAPGAGGVPANLNPQPPSDFSIPDWAYVAGGFVGLVALIMIARQRGRK